MSKPDISVVICTYNRPDTVMQAIASVDGQDLERARVQLVVVDNAPASLHREALSRRGAAEAGQFDYILAEGPGLSKARNVGIRHSEAPVVAFLDDDAVADATWAASILACFDRFPAASVVGGRVRPVWPDERPNWLSGELEGFYSVVDLGPAAKDVGGNEWLAGTNIAFRRNVLTQAGGFPEHLGRMGSALLSNDETALLKQLALPKGGIVYDPAITVQHHVSRERLTQSWLRQRAFWQVISDILAAPGRPRHTRDACLHDISSYLAELPPRYRSMRGFFLDVSDEAIFSKQVRAVGALASLLSSDASDWGE